jgi:hypothetical protein
MLVMFFRKIKSFKASKLQNLLIQVANLKLQIIPTK